MRYTEYETIYIVKPELTEDVVQAIHEKIDGIIDRFEGHVLLRDDWGKRKLAYPIQKNSKGHYTHLTYLGPNDLVAELERVLRLDANLIRFLTVRLADDVDVEVRLAEAEEAGKTRRSHIPDDDSDSSSDGSDDGSEDNDDDESDSD
ncbi:MAG: 30S ribosomal protein S6 [Alphaproteobacteria bacterium]|nr:30S ribosomal protein S6 [Alphaproteobacteria bacterium]MCB9791838.1 30S ribosomal protein S6 [Alphaproteobacteria bacterium]